jgi:hypothetical protein
MEIEISRPLLNDSVEGLARRFRILEVSGSKFGPETDYTELVVSLISAKMEDENCH